MSERSAKMQKALDDARARATTPPPPPWGPPPTDDSYDPGPAGDADGFTIDWAQLDDIQARDVWIALRRFVELITVRYNIPASTIPTCWWEHAELVEELSGLYAAYTALYDPKDNGLGPTTWHEKLAATLNRITRFYPAGCTSTHHDLTRRSWRDVTDENKWDAWINQTHYP